MNWQDNYIDMHSHILPGADDGSESMEQTISMLHMAYKEHIGTIIATPHYIPGEDNPSVEYLRDIAEQVQQQAYKINKNLRILLGNELYYSESIIEELKSGKAMTLADSSYVLVEFAYGIDYKSMCRGINNLTCHGYIPILAHIERYFCLHRDANKVDELVKMGCYIQMNCHSVMGGFFNADASYNRKLLNNNLVHIVSSDCHSDRTRVPMMQTAVKHLLKKCDEEPVKKIFLENPTRILENIYI
ncbi:MAG: protein tyrosine phosphatase [Anaerolineaceae bacterium]|nr:MAG: protein tyrosine phosphatase [Anaerolineaceae bacterium]